MNDIILYHGSRGGIQGKIAPRSRVRCDFGSGFYMGTNAVQAKSLVASDAMPYFYELNVHLSKLPDRNILKLEGLDWAYYVLYNRGRLESVKGSSFYRKYAFLDSGRDFVVGPIADDNMSRVIKEFTDNRITDTALLESIRSIDYGVQYVAKTPMACECIEIVSAQQLSYEETIPLLLENAKKRQEGLDAAESMIRKYVGQGKYFQNILETHEREQQRGQSFSR